MNLEQIDTSTTAGKAEVMRLSVGRRVATRLSERQATRLDVPRPWELCPYPSWNWDKWDYAIISEPVGPEEVWVVEFDGRLDANKKHDASQCFAADVGGMPIRYLRADLAGEKGE